MFDYRNHTRDFKALFSTLAFLFFSKNFEREGCVWRNWLKIHV